MARGPYNPEGVNHWTVEYTEPPTKEGRGYRNNRVVDVYAEDFDRALELFRKKFPPKDAVIYSMRKVGTHRDPIVDHRYLEGH